MSLRSKKAQLSAALGGMKVPKLSVNYSGQLGRQIRDKLQKIVSQRAEDIEDAIDTINDDAVGRLEAMARGVKARYRSKDIPDTDPFTGQTFPRFRDFDDRTGALKSVPITYDIRKSSAKTLKAGNAFTATLRIHAGTVAPDEERSSHGHYQAHTNLSQADGSFQGNGQSSDYFSMVELGTKFMRFSDESYTTFEGTVYPQTRGFFSFDRIVKAEWLRAIEGHQRDLNEQLKIYL